MVGVVGGIRAPQVTSKRRTTQGLFGLKILKYPE